MKIRFVIFVVVIFSIFVSLTACQKPSNAEIKTEAISVVETISWTGEITKDENSLLTSEKTTQKSKEELYRDLDYVSSVIPALSENYDFKVFCNSGEESLRNSQDNLFSFCDWYFRSYLSTEEYIVESGVYGDYEYTLYESGSVCITAYNGKAKELIIPEKINGYTVAYIGDYAFEWNLVITKVVLPDTVLFIDSGAFSNCIFLKEIDLGESLVCLYGSTFYSCNFMKKIKLPDTLLYIGNYSFQSCKLLSEVEGGSSLKFIEGKTFIVVPSLDVLKLPKDVVIESDDSIAPNVKVEYY